MSLSYLKGLRTRYRNLLDKEVAKVDPLMRKHVSTEELDQHIWKINSMKLKLNDYSEKLTGVNEKLSILVEQTEDKKEQTIFEQEEARVMDFLSTVEDAIGELTAYEKHLQGSKASIHTGLEKQMEKLMEIQIQMQQHTKELLQAQAPQHPPQVPFQEQSTSVAVKLPKLDLNCFDGDVLKWKEFWDCFESAIHKNPKLSAIEKFNYLRSKLSGDAIEAIAGMALINENYEIAIKLLQERFGDEQTVINTHYNKIMNLTAAANETNSLRCLYDTIEKHLQSLAVMGQDVNQDIFVSLITSKLPKEVLFQLEIQKGREDKWTVQKLRQLLGSYIGALESAEQFPSASQDKRNFKSLSLNTAKPFPKVSQRSSAEALVISEKGNYQ
ncbi:uncharacterized protein [Ptychodera flava]|uniref:uncharacterized protein n=1 Tax=Ptychodera flava TaxID=63121 RepID=UPI003969F77C